MRKIEYLTNCRQGKLSKILLLWYRYKFRNLSVLTGISIPPNTFGKGLYIPHYGAIVVNGTVRFGDNCVIQNGVNVSDKIWGATLLPWSWRKNLNRSSSWKPYYSWC